MKTPASRKEPVDRAGGVTRSIPVGRAAGAGVALLVAVHLWRVLALFPSPGWILSAEPLAGGRWPAALVASSEAAARLAEHGAPDGYDPWFLNGAPAPLDADRVDRTLAATVALTGLLGSGNDLDSAARAQKLLLVFLLLLAPVLAWHGARNLGMSQAAALLVAALGLEQLWFHDPPRLLGLGLWSSVAASLAAVYLYSLIERILSDGDPSGRCLGIAGLTSVLLVLAHPLALALVAPPAVLRLYLALRRRKAGALDRPSYQRHYVLSCLCVPLLVLWGNIWWLTPAWRAENPLLPPAYPLRSAGLDPVAVLVALLALPGLVAWTAQGAGRRAAALALGGLWLLFLSTWGQDVGTLAPWEPARASAALVPFLALAAVPGLLALARWTFRGRAANEAPWAVAGCAAVALLGASPLSGPVQSWHGLPPEAMQVLDLVRHETPMDGRGLVEAGGPGTAGADIAALVPVLTGRPLASAPTLDARSRYGFAACDPMRPFGMMPTTWTVADLMPLIEACNVRWILAHSGSDPSAGRRLSSALVPRLEQAAKAGGPVQDTGLGAGGYRLFLIAPDRAPSWFARGSGRVTLYRDRLLLEDLVPDHGEVVLRFHHVPGLQAEPPCPITAVPGAPGDPVGWIHLKDPAPAVLLTVRTGLGWAEPAAPDGD